jgi:exosortase family protein XrtM
VTPAPSSTRGLYFVARATALMAVLYGVYYYPYAVGSAPYHVIHAFLQMQASGSAWLIKLFDSGVGVRGTLISGVFPLEVVRSCSSLDAQALYAATVLAFPSRGSTKLLGLVLGFIALTALNMVRIASLYFVGAHAPGAFDAVHEELFPIVLIVIACACFAGWAHWALHRTPDHAAV